MRKDVLLLNANAAPVSWLPLSAISWQNAIRLIWLDVVEVLHVYDNWQVHSPSTTIEVPSVIMLRRQVGGLRTWICREDSPQAYLVFLRDSFTCQYCLKVFPPHRLTIDHVLPKYYGGRTIWSNVCCCCQPCNNRRGHDIRIQPKTRPFRPSLAQLVKTMKKLPISIPHVAWNQFLGWDQKLVRVGPIDSDYELEL